MSPPTNRWTQSLVIRLGIALGAIVALALGAIASGTIFAEASTGKAAAINIAGSLRMQTYRLSADIALLEESGSTDAARAAIAEFEARLNHPQLLAVLPGKASDPARQAYHTVSQHWRDTLKPLAERSLAGSRGNGERAASLAARRALAQQAPAFVTEIHTLVEVLENDLERGIQTLRFLQGIALFLIIAVVFLTLYVADAQVLRPLADLLQAARRVRLRDFGARVTHTESDELGELGTAFNIMVEDLARMYAELERRVEEKTAALEETNRSLELLYRVTGLLSAKTITRDTLDEVLLEVQRLLGIDDAVICARQGEVGAGLKIAALHHTNNGEPVLCDEVGCEKCLAATAACAAPASSEPAFTTVTIGDGQQKLGVMPVRASRGRAIEPWQEQVLATVGRHLAAALAAGRQHEEAHRLKLLEERSIIARELHDSLAQSLSYLKIQVVRLATELKRDPHRAEIDNVVAELKDGLNSAYRQLRELLTTFRLKFDGSGIAAALANTADEFARRAGLRVQIDNRLSGLELSANEEIHVIQIIREALSNVEHHAQADEAEVRLLLENANRVRVTVRDNGRGIQSKPEAPHHYGMTIMRDRAKSLHGEVRWDCPPGGGTVVTLSFPAKLAMGTPKAA